MIKFYLHIVPHCVSVHLQFSSNLFQQYRHYRRGGTATYLLLFLQDSPRYFPLPVNWTITLVALIPQKRVFAKTVYFLAHLLFGSSFTLCLHFSSFSFLLCSFFFFLFLPFSSFFVYLT